MEADNSFKCCCCQLPFHIGSLKKKQNQTWDPGTSPDRLNHTSPDRLNHTRWGWGPQLCWFSHTVRIENKSCNCQGQASFCHPGTRTLDSVISPVEVPTTGDRPLDPFSGRSGKCNVYGEGVFPKDKREGWSQYQGASNKKRITSNSHSFVCLGKRFTNPSLCLLDQREENGEGRFSLLEANCLKSWLWGMRCMNCPYLLSITSSRKPSVVAQSRLASLVT